MKTRYIATMLIFVISGQLFNCSEPDEDDTKAPGPPLNLIYDTLILIDRGIILSWTAPVDNDVERYSIHRNLDGGEFIEIAQSIYTTYQDTNLDYDVEYGYKVLAIDGAGNKSSFSNILKQSPPDLAPPPPPYNLEYDVNLSGDGSIYLSWQSSYDEEISGYKLYRDTDTGVFNEIGTTSSNYYFDIGLDYYTQYTYKVTAEDNAGNESVFSNIVSLTPINRFSPATPNGIEIRAHNIPAEFQTNVELFWNPNTEIDFSHYGIYRSELPLFAANESSFLDSITNNYYEDNQVTPGITYYYKLLAFDLGGLSSDPSFALSDTPLEVPELLSPIDDNTTSSATPTFVWENISHAIKYRIVVRTSSMTGDIWEVELTATTENTMSITYPSNATTQLESNTRYYWFISSYSQDTDEINCYSDINAFRTP